MQAIRVEEMSQSSKGKPETNKNTWASLVYRSLPEEHRKEIDQKHSDEVQRQTEERLKEKEKRVKQYEENYVRRMERKYGLRDTSSGYGRGDFWFFFVEGTKDNSTIAQKMREDTRNQSRFKQYIAAKYDNYYNDVWIFDTEGSKDDCLFLKRWREEHAQKMYGDKIEAHRRSYIMYKQLEKRFMDCMFDLEFGPDWKNK